MVLKNAFQKVEIQILWDIYDQTQTAISIIYIFYFIITIEILQQATPSYCTHLWAICRSNFI